jgi:hypothetical protein
MKAIQIIELDGRVAALALGEEEAVIRDDLTKTDRRRAQIKALYALQIAAGERPGPYTDAGAERYARAERVPSAGPRARARGR